MTKEETKSSMKLRTLNIKLTYKYILNTCI